MSSWSEFKKKKEKKVNSIFPNEDLEQNTNMMQNILGVGENLVLGASNGIKSSFNYGYKTAENKVVSEQKAKNRRVAGSKELTNQEKAIYLASHKSKKDEILPTINLQSNDKLPFYQAKSNYSEADNKNNNIENETSWQKFKKQKERSIEVSETEGNEKIEYIANNNELDKSIQKDNIKIQENIEKQSNDVTRKLSELAPSIGNMGVGTVLNVINPGLGMAYFTTSAGGNYMQDAIDRGMTQEEAITYGSIMGLMEGATELVGLENLNKAGKGVKNLISGAGKTALKETSKEATKISLKTVLKDYGIGIADNIMQEALIEPIQEVTAGLVGGNDKADFNDIGQRMLKSGIDGGLTSAIIGGANLGIESCVGIKQKIENREYITKEALQQAVKEASEQLDIEKMIIDSTQQQVNKYKTSTQQTQIPQNQENNLNKQITLAQNKNGSNTNLNIDFNINNNSIYNTTAKQYNIDINNETVQTIDKITNQRGIQAKYDASIFENSNINAVWRTNTDISGNTTREIIINPNSDSSKTLQNIIIHELTHDLEGTREYNELQNLILNYNKKNIDYESARKSLEETYSKVYDGNSNEFQTLINQEVVADILGNKLGDQNFVNTLTTEKPSLGKRIYNWVIDKLNKINKLTGYKSEKIFWTDIKNKFENAYKQEYQYNNKNSINTKYSIVYNQDGSFNRVKINDNIFENNNGKSISNTIKDYLENHINEYANIIESGQKVYLGTDLPGEYAFSKSSQKLPMNEKLAKGRASSGLKEIIENVSSRNYEKNRKTKHNIDAKYGFYKYDTKFSFDYNGREQIYEGTVVIRNDADGKKYLYDITNVKKIGSNLLPVASNSQKSSAMNGSSNPLPTNSITSQNKEVNTTDKYSMQESENNSDSFSIPRVIAENDKMKSYTINKPFKIAESYKIYRGISENGNTGTAMYGEGLYTTTNKNYAKKFGDVIEIDRSQLPKKPLQFKTEIDFSQWEKELANSLEIKRNELYNNSNNVDVYVKQLGYDGITIGTGKDMTIVTYPQEKYSIQNTKNNEWQVFLDKHYKNSGKGETIKDVKLPVKQNRELNIPISYDAYISEKSRNNIELLTDEDYKVINKIYEKEGRTEVLTEKRKAKILEKYANDKYKIKDSLDVLAQKIVNKGHYIDKLSEKANNPELKFMYDRNLNSFAEGQYVIGVAQTDNKGNKIGKSINEIWKPVEDMKLTKEFSEYLLHKHNIDRSGRGKYVLGEDIGPTESTAIALELEQKHPEFKQYAKDIKDFNHNNLINLKEAGLLTQDIIEYLEGMYPNYVTISRDIEEKLYVGDDKKTGVGAPIKQATGGSTDIKPLKDTMAEQIIKIKKLINQNKLGQELAKTLKNAKVEQQSNIEATPAVLLEYDTLVGTDNKGNKFYTYFKNGIQQKLKINEDLYESLKPTQISRFEQSLPMKAVQKVASINRSLLTSNNPLFIATNFFKDFQDGMFNSKYASKFVKNYGKALNEVITKGKYYESYMANGGMTNTYFDYNEGITKQSNKFVQKIRNVNEIVEQLPRISEFISTLEDGKSLNEALYNAAEVTTNFKRGGDIAKALNRNGANFFNASIQGFDKFCRNFSGKNGAKGYVNILAKATIMGILPSIINYMLLKDDEDYEDLPDSDKDLYYLFKCADGKFIRIPKGRVLSIFGSAGRRALESIEGKEGTWGGFIELVDNQILPNNPLEDNILAPIRQVKNNKTWYGSDLVSSRLQKELPENQYDETTDEFSKWLGKQLNASPKKINYLIDQYSGGIGDILLPIITPQAKQNVFKDKFTTDSVLKNRHVSEFYSTLEKQTQIANDSFATDEDEIQLKYLNDISKSMGELYKQKREIQMSDISNKEKTEQVREIQEQINKLAEEGLINYNKGTYNKNYSKIDNQEYYKNGKGEWVKLNDEETEKNKDISIKTYSDYKQKIYTKTQEKRKSGELEENEGLKTRDKIQVLLGSDYTDKETVAIYENYIKSENDNEYEILSKFNIKSNIKEYLKYKQQKFESDYEEDGTDSGKSISGSKKKKVYEYVNNSKLTYNQKLIILGMQYKLTDTERKKLYNIVDNNKELTAKEKQEFYKKFQGFTVYKDGKVSY